MNKLTQLKNLWFAMAVVIACVAMQTAHAGMSFKFYGNISGIGLAIPGTDVEELYVDDQFPDEPDAIDFATSIPGLSGIVVDATSGRWEWPQPFATGNSGLDNYGAVATGLFIAPVTGTYQFFLRADDGSAIYITDEPLDLDDLKGDDRPTPDGIETGCCGQFGKTGTVSGIFDIEAGSGKFITQTWKEGGGGDWMQLGISVNGGPVEVLSLGHVQRYEFSDDAPAGEDLLIAGFGPDGVIDEFSIEVNESQTANVYVEFDKEGISGLDDIPAITWEVDGTAVEGQKGSLLSFVPAADADEEQVTREVKATVAGFGSATFEVFVNRDDISPSVVSAQGSGNPKGIIVNFSELVDEASATNKDNYKIEGQDITIESVEVVTGTSVVLKVSDYNTDPLTVTVSGVTDRSLAKNVMEEGTVPVAISTNLLAYWPFDDADDADNAVDVAGGHVGEIRDAAYTEDGGGASGEDGDYGMDFGSDNAGQFILVEDASFLNASAISNQMTVSFWQKNAGTANSSSYWMWSQGINGGGRGNQAHVPWGNQQIYFDTQGCCGGGTERINRNINQFDDFYDGFYLDWHHYTFIKNGDRKEIWVDGKLFHSGTNNEDFTADFVRLSIGSADNGGNSSQAVMDDFAIFSVALTEAQVNSIVDGGSPGDLAEPLSKALELTTDLSAASEAEELKAFSLSVEVTGGEPFTIGYQWYENGVAMVGQNGPSLSWTETPKGIDGNKYSVRAFNKDGTFNELASTETTLTVNNDVKAPEIVSVSGNPLNNGVVIELNEKVNADDVSASNFSIAAIAGGTGSIGVNSATLQGDQLTVVLETDTQDSAVKYEVTIKSIKDVSANANEATNITGDFISWAKRAGGATSLLYTGQGGTALDAFFPEDLRGTGTPAPGYAPVRIGQITWDNVNQGFSSIIPFLESPNGGDINTGRVNARNNYGQMVFGWLKPSVTGKYLIALAVDDNSELYLSTDDSPANTELVASEDQWNGNRQYNDGTKETNWTEPIDLEAGKEYYFEAYMKEGGGGDNLAIAWSWTTDGSDPEVPANGSNPIPGENLVTYQPVENDHSVDASFPGDGSGGVHIDTEEVSITFADGRFNKIVADSIEASLGGAKVDATVTVDGDVIKVAVPVSGNFGQGQEITLEVTYNTEDGESNSASITFTTEDGLPTLGWKADIGKGGEAGMLVNARQSSGGRGNNTAEAEAQIAGDADLFEADGVVAQYINHNQGAGGAGRFGNDLVMPDEGLMDPEGNTDNITWEVLTYVELPAGIVTMTVNSDDGFRVTHGEDPKLSDDDVQLGVFSGGRGAADTTFRFIVPMDGIYPMRLLWYEGGGGANVEWWTTDGTGARHLINGPDDDAAFKAYQSAEGVTAIAVEEPAEFTGAPSVDGNNITLNYTGTLQSAPSANGPWTDVAGASSPFTEAMTDASKFYRVVQ